MDNIAMEKSTLQSTYTVIHTSFILISQDLSTHPTDQSFLMELSQPFRLPTYASLLRVYISKVLSLREREKLEKEKEVIFLSRVM
jgi:hypothetical protein